MSRKNEKIGENQPGFKEKRGKKDHIFTLNSIISNRLMKRGEEELYASFIDFKTAYDSVDMEVMMKKLKK